MRRITLRWRLTLLTTLLLTIMCAALALMSQHQVQSMLVAPMHAVITTEMAGIGTASVPAQQIMPGAETGSADMLPEDGQTVRAAVLATAADVLDTGAAGYSARLWLILGGIVLLGAALTYVVAGLALRPVRKLTGVIEHMDADSLECDLDIFRSEDEVGRLSCAFNALIERVRDGMERERRFHAYAAHELKTPLSVIKTALDVLDMDDAPDVQDCMEALDVVRKQNGRMIGLMRQLLVLSSSGRAADVRVLRLDELICEVICEMQPIADDMHAALKYSVQPSRISADPDLLRHALTNVIENAIKYGEGSDVMIDMACKGVNIEVSVSDGGSGISPEDAAHIFEPFYRADKSRSRMGGGAGLGLAIVSSAVARCGGQVRYESVEPKGSRFVMTFPCARWARADHA